MWPPTITECECAEPGFCHRHQCVKGYWQHRLCRRQPTVFDAYERGEGCGQGQDPITVSEETTPGTDHAPGLLQRGWNFANAGIRHVANGLATVPDDVYETRLTECRRCELCDLQHMVCLQPKCGCFLNVKARWASEACPLGKWKSTKISSVETK